MEYPVNRPEQIWELVQTKGYKLLIFDFDGTLVDTFQDVAVCFNEALKRHSFPEWNLDDIKTLIGGDLETIVSRLLPAEHRSRFDIDAVKRTYRELYLEYEKPNSIPYEGIKELVETLAEHDILMAINSNKGKQLLDEMVEQLFRPSTFCMVVGYDESFPSKPDPYGVNVILSANKIKKENAIYVGDGNSDRLTAENAGLDLCFVKWEL